MRVRLTAQLPEGLDLTPLALKQFASGTPEQRERFIANSPFIWEFLQSNETVLVCGLYRPSLVGHPELWLLMCSAFFTQFRRNLEECRMAFATMALEFPNVRVHIGEANLTERRFARFIGLKEIGPSGQDYIAFEVA